MYSVSVLRKGTAKPTKYLNICPAELCWASIGKYETDDKCYAKLGCNIITKGCNNSPMNFSTKVVVIAVTTKLVVLAYF